MNIFNSIEILIMDNKTNIRKLFEREMASPATQIGRASCRERV